MIFRGLGQELAPVSMPLLPASACSSGQTYISPGSAFTSGSMAGKVTPTGACQDNVQTASTATGFSFSSPLNVGGIYFPVWMVVGVVGIGVLLVVMNK